MAKFDRHASDYEAAIAGSIGFAGKEHDFYTELKARQLLDLAMRLLGDPAGLDVLDAGCGIGLTDVHLTGRVRTLAGTDVSEEALVRARAAHPEVDYRLFDGRSLPFGEAEFDLAFAISVFHHVPPPDRLRLARELARVIRPGRLVVVFEHNLFNPLTRLAVDRCAFDEDAVLLRRRETAGLLRTAGLDPAESRYVVFFPWRGRLFRRCERALAPVPLGAQYYCAARKPA